MTINYLHLNFFNLRPLLVHSKFAFRSESASKVPEITTSSAPEDDDNKAETSNSDGKNAAELLKDEEYVEKLADSLSKRLEKTRSKIKKRVSELSLIKASPDSKNPSVILSCASSDEEDEPPANPEPRASLTADQPSTSAKLFRGLKKRLSREKKEIPKVVTSLDFLPLGLWFKLRASSGPGLGQPFCTKIF